MSDDEDARDSGSLAEGDDFEYVDTDSTRAVEGPGRLLLVMPAFPSTSMEARDQRIAREAECFVLPHSRTGADALFGIFPAAENQRVLCQIHLHNPPLAALFVDSMIEPDGAVRVATPVDLTYLGAWILVQSGQYKTVPTSTDVARWLELGTASTDGYEYPFKYKCVEDVLTCDPRLEPLRWAGLRPALTTALRNVADFQDVDEDFYFRLNTTKLIDFCKARFEAVLGAKVLRKVVYPDRRVEPRVGPNIPAVETGRSRRSSTLDASATLDTVTPQRGAENTANTPAPESGDADVSPTPTGAETPAAPPADSTAPDDFMRLRALNLVLECIPKIFHSAIAKACHVELDTTEGSTRTRATKQAQVLQAQALEREAARDFEPLESAAKKHRAETNPKSASVKKLEKSGPPKNTPTLAAMFAKSAAKTPKGGDASPS